MNNKSINEYRDDTLPLHPKGWVWVRLGEICFEPQYGWTTRAITKGNIHLLRTSDITSGSVIWDKVPFCEKEPLEKDKYVLKDGDIVISRAGSVGYSCLIKNPKDAIFASYLIRFRTLINEKYLAFFLKSPLYWHSILERRLGITIPNVNASKLKQIPLPLPPLPEQQRIVAKIEELFTKLDAGVEALKKAKEQIKRYRQAVLKYAFEGKLTEEWRKSFELSILNDELKQTQNPQLNTQNSTFKTENSTFNTQHSKFTTQNYESASVLLEQIKEERKKKLGKKYKELPPIDTSELPELPEGWVWVRLDNCSELITKGESPKWQGFNYIEDGIPFIRSENVLWGKVDISNTVKIPIDFHNKLKRSQIKGYDILINLVGASIGRCGVVQSNINAANINQAVALIRTNNLLAPFYLMYLLLSPKFQQIIHSNKVETARPNISLEDLKTLILPLLPLPEQHRIVEEIERRFSVADEVEKAIDNSLKQAERLRQSILKKAFEGKLVPQDPNDEPAEKLLERVRKSLQL